MFTLHHGFWIYFFTRRHPQVWQFVAGSMLPDYIYILLSLALIIQKQIQWTELFTLSPTLMMAYLPLYPWAVHIDLIGHSAVIWAAVGAATLLPVFNKWQAFVIGWGTHLLLDGLTHAAHANFYLYPLSLLAVHSPVSYWEPEYFAREFKLVNGSLMILAGFYLCYHWWKNKQR